MATFLLKTEPGAFSYADLERAGRTAWDGVTNPAAQKHMRAMRAGDEALIYHTGEERRVAGLARVVRGAYPDPAHPGVTASGDPKRVLVDLEGVRAAGAGAGAGGGGFTLGDAKGDARFARFALVTQARLSVMPVPEELDAVIRERAGLA